MAARRLRNDLGNMPSIRRFIVLSGAAALLLPVATDAQPADTARVSTKPLFTQADGWILGGLTLASVVMIQFDKPTIQAIQRDTNEFRLRTAERLRYVNEKSLLALDVLLYGIGRISGNERLADLGLHGAEAIAVASVVSTLIKSTTGRPRPFLSGQDAFAFEPNKGWSDGKYRSFPSLHVAGSFAFATALVAETRQYWPKGTRIYAPILYVAAISPGVARIYDNFHWPSDVLLGSLIGIYAGAKTVRYAHSHPGNRVDRWMLGASGVDGVPMIVLTRRF